jgi:hypothetical protein
VDLRPFNRRTHARTPPPTGKEEGEGRSTCRHQINLLLGSG